MAISPHDNPLHDRERGLEEAYFRQKDAELAEKLRSIFQAKVDREELKSATGITDETLIDRFMELNLRGELLTAFKLYPLVEVVWADGVCERKEAEAVMKAAAGLGVARESAAGARIQEWLRDGPTEAGRAAWRMYAEKLRATLTAAQLEEFRRDLHAHAVAVAEASGGVLDMFFNVSGSEKKIIAAIDKLLSGK